MAEEVGAEYGRAMADARGFAAHADGHHEELRIIDDHCPFGHVAIEHPVICAVDRGMIRETLGTLVGDPIHELTTEASFARGDTFCVTTV